MVGINHSQPRQAAPATVRSQPMSPLRETPLTIPVAGFARIRAVRARPNYCESGYDPNFCVSESLTAFPSGAEPTNAPTSIPKANTQATNCRRFAGQHAAAPPGTTRPQGVAHFQPLVKQLRLGNNRFV